MRHTNIIIILLAAMLMAACSKEEDIGYTTTVDLNQDDDDTTEPVNDSYTYKLPVIFHVLYTTDNDSVRSLAAYLPQVLTYVNELYEGDLYGWPDRETKQMVYSEDINVDFQLAQADENGNQLSTPGVVFEKWDGSFPIEASSFMSSNNTNLMWEPNEYINVMVYPFEQNTEGSVILGISHMPYCLDDSTALDGLETTSAHYMSKRNLKFPYCVSINSDYIYRMSSRYYITDSIGNRTYGRTQYTYDTCDIVATLAHELGHYLGLHHVFSEEKTEKDGQSSWSEVDDCIDSDFCDDTPSYNKVAYNQFLSKMTSHTSVDTLMSRTSCDGSTYQSRNIMDYSFCYSFLFSPEQKQRIRHVLYYSPLIPGPKINGVNHSTRAAVDEEGIINLPIVTSE